jgi:hypothetical protein
MVRPGVRLRTTTLSPEDLITAIEDYIDGWNEPCRPFT